MNTGIKELRLKKILIINLMPLGDLLLTTPFLRAVRNIWPDSEITLLADARWSDIVSENPCINKFIPLDKKRDHNTIFKQLKFIAAIRKKHYDLVINLHYNERSSLIAVCSGAKLRIGYANKYFARFMDLYQENRCLQKHIVESHYDILREKLGIAGSAIRDQGLELYISEEIRFAAAQLWLDKWHGAAPGKVIGLNIGASWPTKRWPVEYFAELAAKFIWAGYGIAFFGSRQEAGLVNECLTLLDEKKLCADRNDLPVAVFTGELTLTQLAAMLGKCAALVTNDSGPLHIAISQKVPAVSFYGPSPVPGFAPFNSYAVVLKSALPCHPCRKWQCPKGTLECMYNITPETAYSETVKLLDDIAAGRDFQTGACTAEVKEY